MQQAESAILAQNLLRLVRSNRVRRIVLSVTLPFVGVVAAFGIAPDTATDQIVYNRVQQTLALPAPQATDPADEVYWREERVQRGDTVAELLNRMGVQDPEAMQVLRNTRGVRGLYQLAPGRTVRARTDGNGRLLGLRYATPTQELLVEREGDRLTVREQPLALETRVHMRSGEIRSSLFAATDAANLSDAVATQLADIFSTDIDFHRDLRRGDRFTVVYEAMYTNGEPVRTGRVLAAEFVNQGKTFHAYWFKHADGQGGYYTLEGKNIRKAFLRSPIEFSRVTSGFSLARFHPVLQTLRAHKGIDYGAPQGTGVRATADGHVEFAGRQGGYGNVVILRHQSRYTTLYGHLAGFGKNVKTGARVSQGDIIGYVGATGLATGPHLHYEFRINDVHQDPLRVAMPEAPPIMPEQRGTFDAAIKPLVTRLTLQRGINYAQLD